MLVEDRPGVFDDARHRLVPGGRPKQSGLADQRSGQAVRRTVGLPPEQTLRAEPTVVHTIVGAAAHADDPPVGHGDVHTATVRAHHARRLHPIDLGGVGVGQEILVDPNGPLLPRSVRGSWPPDVGDPIAHRHVPFRRRDGAGAPTAGGAPIPTPAPRHTHRQACKKPAISQPGISQPRVEVRGSRR